MLWEAMIGGIMRAMSDTKPDSHPDSRLTVQFLEVPGELEGQRIDNFLMARLKGVPKSRVYRILRKGEVRVNKKRVKAEYRLVAGDVVRVPPIRMSEQAPAPVAGESLRREIENAILFDRDGLLIVNKPAGVAVHGGSGIKLGLIEILRQMYPQSPFLELVHRLDRDTSGAIMVARKRSVLLHVQKTLRSGGIDKHYQALTVGKWPRGRREVDAPLHKFTLKSGERMVRVDAQGKPSLTTFRVAERFKGATLVDATPVTGRTHQIRVHAQFVGCPLAGDPKYTSDEDNAQFRALGLKRLFLHSARVGCTLPDGERVSVEAPLPEDLAGVLERLRNQ
ncbi:23S rRNA pseudouridine(955/2504/2580) synthase RluC [Biformimicrobium ophioploci]|uniref:Pseudouridine synthase n=2 Tax=Biformimicrobium ophioploci TaxID=3036711 RepID=A0ABQ6M200_9GAMM|nr:23S rRNA pseudouridine(955/2504/2580) synthase RluC [Microbulbifer sp. NKW57]